MEYCNPLNLNYKYQHFGDKAHREGADPTLLLFKGTYYLFVSMSAGFYYSDDLMHWNWHENRELDMYNYAPDVRRIGEYVYFCASDKGRPCTIWCSRDPLSDVWEKVSAPFDFWDPDLFCDDDGRVYLVWGSSNDQPIWGQELDPETMTPIGEKVGLYYGDKSRHGFERFIFCKEIVVDEPKADGKATTNDLSLKESLGLIGKNKYLFIVVGLMLLTFVVNNMQTATTYYFKYIYGDLAAQGTAAITSMVVVPALIFFPMLSKKFGTTKILQVCSGVGIAGMLIRTIGGPNMTTIIIGGLLFGIGTLPVSMMINTYLIDCMDYGEWKTGVRIEGLVASIANFASKVGQGIAVGLVGLIMGLAGYDGLAAVQTQTANNAIVFLYNILPMILFVAMFVLAMMYKVDSIRPQMNADLAARHGEAKAE